MEVTDQSQSTSDSQGEDLSGDDQSAPVDQPGDTTSGGAGQHRRSQQGGSQQQATPAWLEGYNAYRQEVRRGRPPKVLLQALGPMTDKDKKDRRRAANRESARRMRARRIDNLRILCHQMTALQDKFEQLQLHISTVSSSYVEMSDENRQLRAQLAEHTGCLPAAEQRQSRRVSIDQLSAAATTPTSDPQAASADADPTGGPHDAAAAAMPHQVPSGAAATAADVAPAAARGSWAAVQQFAEGRLRESSPQQAGSAGQEPIEQLAPQQLIQMLHDVMDSLAAATGIAPPDFPTGSMSTGGVPGVGGGGGAGGAQHRSSPTTATPSSSSAGNRRADANNPFHSVKQEVSSTPPPIPPTANQPMDPQSAPAPHDLSHPFRSFRMPAQRDPTVPPSTRPPPRKSFSFPLATTEAPMHADMDLCEPPHAHLNPVHEDSTSPTDHILNPLPPHLRGAPPTAKHNAVKRFPTHPVDAFTPAFSSLPMPAPRLPSFTNSSIFTAPPLAPSPQPISPRSTSASWPTNLQSPPSSRWPHHPNFHLPPAHPSFPPPTYPRPRHPNNPSRHHDPTSLRPTPTLLSPDPFPHSAAPHTVPYPDPLSIYPSFGPSDPSDPSGFGSHPLTLSHETAAALHLRSAPQQQGPPGNIPLLDDAIMYDHSDPTTASLLQSYLESQGGGQGPLRPTSAAMLSGLVGAAPGSGGSGAAAADSLMMLSGPLPRIGVPRGYDMHGVGGVQVGAEGGGTRLTAAQIAELDDEGLESIVQQMLMQPR